MFYITFLHDGITVTIKFNTTHRRNNINVHILRLIITNSLMSMPWSKSSSVISWIHTSLVYRWPLNPSSNSKQPVLYEHLIYWGTCHTNYEEIVKHLTFFQPSMVPYEKFDVWAFQCLKLMTLVSTFYLFKLLVKMNKKLLCRWVSSFVHFDVIKGSSMLQLIITLGKCQHIRRPEQQVNPLEYKSKQFS